MRSDLRVFRVSRGGTLFSFGDPILEVPILNRALGTWQEQVVAKHGLDLVDVDDPSRIRDTNYLVFEDHLFFTPQFFASILERARSSSRTLRFCLSHNSFNNRFVLPASPERQDEIPLPILFVDRETADSPERCVVEQRVYEHGIRLPEQVLKGGYFSYPQATSFAAPLHSPFHLLQANLAMASHRGASTRDRFPKGLLDRVAPPFSRRFYWLLRRANRIGRRCLIHPTAVLEGVEIGDDVCIGAHAVVRLSRVGSGTTIEDQASVINSVLGRNNYIFNKNHLAFCMTYDDVFLIHGPYNFSIFGKGSAVFAVINCDFRLDQGNIRIPTDFGIVDSNQALLGIAYGHGSKVGGGNIIAPGRIVPNHLHVNPPGNILTEFPNDRAP